VDVAEFAMLAMVYPHTVFLVQITSELRSGGDT
jgi:hypothetical protein